MINVGWWSPLQKSHATFNAATNTKPTLKVEASAESFGSWHGTKDRPVSWPLPFFFKFKERPLEVNLWNWKKAGKIEGDIQVLVKTGRRIIRDQVYRRPWSVCLKLCVISVMGKRNDASVHISSISCPLWWLLKTCQVGSRCSRATRFLMKRVHSLRNCCP